MNDSLKLLYALLFSLRISHWIRCIFLQCLSGWRTVFFFVFSSVCLLFTLFFNSSFMHFSIRWPVGKVVLFIFFAAIHCFYSIFISMTLLLLSTFYVLRISFTLFLYFSYRKFQVGLSVFCNVVSNSNWILYGQVIFIGRMWKIAKYNINAWTNENKNRK